MTNAGDRHRKELNNIDDRIEELFDQSMEVVADDDDIAAAAARVRSIFAHAHKMYTQRHLIAAQADYERECEVLSAENPDLPTAESEQIALLTAVEAAQPHLLESFTMKYRDFKSMTASDRASLLRQLKQLGVLDLIQK